MSTAIDIDSATLLTGGPQALIPISDQERQFLAAISEDNPPANAVILKSDLQFPSRLIGELREKLKNRNIRVTRHETVSTETLEKLYGAAKSPNGTNPVSVDYDRHRDDVHSLLERAVDEKVSDIHIVRRRKNAFVSFRIAGQIHQRLRWQITQADLICRFIYEVMCTDQDVTWNRAEPQDAVLDTNLATGERIRVRIGTIPASPDGYDMVLRILPGSGATMPLPELGYTPGQMQLLRSLARRPSGLVVMAGSVGSGKSTSLVGLLNEELVLHEGRLRIITVEDPPEREIPGATQVPVVRRHNRDAETDFSDAIRGALRCDPDTLMVGEIRDLQSAILTIKFAQSGHRVYTTLHATSALGIISRLTGLGVSQSMLCTPDVLKGLIYQALVPVLCDGCKIDRQAFSELFDPDGRRRDLLDRTHTALQSRKLTDCHVSFRGAGCSKCGKTGIAGRSLVAETIIPDDTMLAHLAKNEWHEAHLHWVLHLGGRPALESAIEAVSAGRIAPTDLEFRIGELTPADNPADFENVHPLAQHA